MKIEEALGKMLYKDKYSKNNLFTANCKNCGNTKGLKFIEIDDNGNKIHLCKNCLGKRADEIKHYN